MSPIRAYRCEAGHEFTQYEHMDAPPLKHCHEQTGERGAHPVICMRPAERVLSPAIAHVKGGTPRFHKGRT